MWGASKRDSKRESNNRRLRPNVLVPAEKCVVGASGVPGTSDALAVETVQGIVAIATADGKVKLYGAPGVERTLYSAARYPYATRQLAFLKNRGVLMRVAKGGFVECWSLAAGSRGAGGVRSLGTLKARGDKICCVADMARDPYVLLGCASGCLRIAMLVDGTGSPTAQPHHARGLSMAPYRVEPEDLRGEGEVRQLAVQSFGPVHRALVLFTAGMVAVWDLRAVQLVTSINPLDADAAQGVPALAAAGEATAACWIGTERGDFATGHVDGSVLVWALPGLDPGEAAVAAALRVVPGSAAPVRALRCVFGGEDGDGLLVLGGQEAERPDALTLLPLPGGSGHGDEESQEESEGEQGGEEDEDEDGRLARERVRQRRKAAAARRKQKPEPIKLPWFGHIIGFSLVSEGGTVSGYEPPCAVLQLVEGGQLVLQELLRERAGGQPVILTPPFQQRAGVTVTEAPMVPVHRPSGSGPSAISLAALRELAEGREAEMGEDPSGMGAFRGGTAAPLPEDATWGLVYCTGYKDGGVAMWDLHGSTTRLLCAAPAGDAVDSSKLGGGGGAGGDSCGAVTCLSLAWPTGLLIAGHQKGEVRVYQFSAAERQADCVTLESINTPGAATPLRQPPGLQLRLRVRVNSGEVTSLAYCQAIRAVAAGDKAGGVALIDTARPLVRWYAMPGQQAVLAAALAPLPLPPPRLRVPEVQGDEGAPSHAVVVADSDGCLAALDAARGCFIGRGGELRPKNHSYSLALELLDEGFMPLWSRQQAGAGCDQSALGARPHVSPRSAGHGHRRRTAADEDEEEGEDEDSEEEEEEQRDYSRKGSSRRAGSSGRRIEFGGNRGATRQQQQEEPEEQEEGDAWDDAGVDEDEMDVEAMLARAAAQVEGTGSPPRSRHAAGGRPRGSGRRGGPVAEAYEDEGSAAPAVLSSCPDPTAHYVLLVTDQYLRLYSAANVVAGDRSTAAKRSLPAGQSLLFARPLLVAGSPGVLALAAGEHGLLKVQVYSLPSLELVHEAALSSSLSWYWDLPPGCAAERRLGRLVAASRLGEVLLLGLGNELLRLGLAAGLPPPAVPLSLFDPGAAAASLAAAAEYEAERLRPAEGRLGRAATGGSEPGLGAGEGSLRAAHSGISETIEGVDLPTTRSEGRGGRVPPPAAAAPAAAAGSALAVPRAASERAPDRTAGAAGAREPGSTTLAARVFSRVQQGLSRAVVETTKGVRQLATNVERGVASVQAALVEGGAGGGGGGGGGGGRPPAAAPRSAEWYASLPDLGAVFARTAPEEGAAAAGTQSRHGRHPQPQPQPRQQQQQRQQRGRHGAGREQDDDDDDDDVSELSVTDDDDDGSGGGGGGGGSSRGFPARGRGAPAAPRAAPPPPPPQQPPHRSQPAPASRSSGGESEQSLRAELFGGARPFASSGGGGGASSAARPPASAGGGGGSSHPPRARTADEIKRAYGRAPAEGSRAGAASARANEVRAVMEENRSRLEERGQKLRQLGDKAADLENSAAGFAEMARQLAERERNKKWWQL